MVIFFPKFPKTKKFRLTSIHWFSLFFLLSFGVLIIVMLSKSQLFGKDNKINPGNNDKKEIRLKGEDTEVKISNNGLVEIKSPENTYYQNWDSKKINQLFDGLNSKLGLKNQNFDVLIIEKGNEDYLLNYLSNGDVVERQVGAGDQGLVDILQGIDDLAGGQTGGSLNDSSNQSSGDISGGNNDGGTGGSSNNSTIPDCPFWKLSYCVFPPGYLSGTTPSVSPSPSSSLLPGEGETVFNNASQRPPECDLWGEQVSYKTAISNTICNIDQ